MTPNLTLAKRTTTRHALAMICAAMTLTVAACGSNDPSNGKDSPRGSDAGETEPTTVKALTMVSYPPTTMVDASGNFSGSDLDLLKAVLEKVGMVPEFTVTKNYDSLVPAIQAGRADIGVDGVGDTEERRQVVYLVDYNEVTDVLVARKGTSTPEQLCGKKIGVVSGSAGYKAVFEALADYCPDNPMTEVKVTGTDLSTFLLSGRVDGYIQDSLSAEGTVEKRPELQIASDPLPIPTGGIVGFVVAKENCDLAMKLQEGLKAIIADGTYDKILEQYGTESYSYKEATVNLEPTLSC